MSASKDLGLRDRELRFGRRVLSHPLAHPAAVDRDVQPVLGGGRALRRLEVLLGLAVAAGLGARHPPVNPVKALLRIDLQRAVELFEGLADVPLDHQGHAEAVAHVGVFRVRLDDVAIRYLRLVRTPFTQKDRGHPLVQENFRRGVCLARAGRAPRRPEQDGQGESRPSCPIHSASTIQASSGSSRAGRTGIGVSFPFS